jgi:hypothetical protein
MQDRVHEIVRRPRLRLLESLVPRPLDLPVVRDQASHSRQTWPRVTNTLKKHIGTQSAIMALLLSTARIQISRTFIPSIRVSKAAATTNPKVSAIPTPTVKLTPSTPPVPERLLRSSTDDVPTTAENQDAPMPRPRRHPSRLSAAHTMKCLTHRPALTGHLLRRASDMLKTSRTRGSTPTWRFPAETFLLGTCHILARDPNCHNIQI